MFKIAACGLTGAETFEELEIEALQQLLADREFITDKAAAFNDLLGAPGPVLPQWLRTFLPHVDTGLEAVLAQ